MSVLTDFILATDGDTDYLMSGLSLDRFAQVETTDFDSVLLAMLYHLATGESEDEFMAEYDDSELAYSEDGPWLYKLPSAFVTQLSQLPAARLQQIAQTLAASEDCDGCQAAPLNDMLTRLCVLARQALNSPVSAVFYRMIL